MHKRSIEEELKQARQKEEKTSSNRNNKLYDLDSRISDTPSEHISCISPDQPRLRDMPQLVVVDSGTESSYDPFASEAEERKQSQIARHKSKSNV